MLKNCPNCGAPVDAYLDKCPYCKTYTYDFSEVEVNGKPMFLRIRDKENIIVTPVICTNLSMTVQPQMVSYLGFKRERFVRTNADIEIELNFRNVAIWR